MHMQSQPLHSVMFKNVIPKFLQVLSTEVVLHNVTVSQRLQLSMETSINKMVQLLLPVNKDDKIIDFDHFVCMIFTNPRPL